MAFTKRHRDIVNPFPENFSNEERDGSSYHYGSTRNLWVMEAIHDSYINFGIFPQIGHKMELIGPLNDGNRYITLEDARAYAAMYPQNCKVVPDIAAKINTRFNPRLSNGLGYLMKRLSPLDSFSELRNIAESLEQQRQLYKFISKSTPEAQFPDNQVPDDNGEISIDSKTQMMVVVPFITSAARVLNLRLSMGYDVDNFVSPNEPLESIRTKTTTSSISDANQDPDIDMDDWAANVSPEKQKNIVYYNPKKRRYYFSLRTNSRNPEDYKYNLTNLNEKTYINPDNINSFKDSAAESLLVFLGAESKDISNKQDILSSLVVETKYGDSSRPLPPANRGVWLLNASVSKDSVLNLLNVGEDSTVVSTQEQYFYPSPVITAKNIIQNTIPSKEISKRIETHRENISKTSFLLDFYSQQLTSQGVSPSDVSGLNLEQETQKLTFFNDALNSMFAMYNIVPDDADGLEIKFSEDYEIEYVVYKGTVLISYIGKDISSLKNKNSNMFLEQTKMPVDTESSQNVFSNMSPTSFSYLYHSPEIAAEAMVADPKQRVPWTEFLEKYTYPDINRASIRSSKLSFKQRFDRDGLDAEVQLMDASKLHKTIKEKEIILAKRIKITSKDLYLKVASAIGECDTAQAELLGDGIRLYSAITGKTSIRKLLASSISEIRTRLIEDKETQKYLQDAEGYISNPNKIAREIEQEINNELGCILDIVGDSVAAILPLVPSGTANKIGDLTKNTAKSGVKSLYGASKNTLSGITIPRAPSKNLMDVYIDKVTKILEGMVKSFILSIFKDVVKASLGCGPTQKNDKPDISKQRNNNVYSLIRINNLVEEQGDIDLVDVARSMGIQNYLVTSLGDSNSNADSIISSAGDITSVLRPGADGNSYVYLPPTTEQLIQFNEDVSDILTRTEALALLGGDATEQTMGLIQEMIFDGHYDMEGLSESQKNNVTFMKTRQESYKAGDIRYATLDLTPMNIVEYFGKIGSLLDDLDLLEDEDEMSPEDAYCEFKEPPAITPADMGLSSAQVQEQIEQQIEAKKDKIDSYCEQYLRPMLSLDSQLSNLFDDLEPPAFYTSLLGKISEGSNDAAEAARQALASLTQRPPPTPPSQNLEDYELYTVIDRVFDQEKSFGQLRINSDGLPEWYLGNPDTFGEMSFTFNNENARFRFSDNTNEEEPNRILAISELSQDNVPCIEDVTYSLRNLTDSEGRARGLPQIDEQVLGIINTALNNLEPGNPNLVVLSQRFGNTGVFPKVKNAGLIVQNKESAARISELVADFYVTATDTFNAPERFRKFSKAITSATFNIVPGACLGRDEEAIAEAAMNSLHARVMNFFLNVGPLLRAYNGWNMPDLLNALTEYLTSEIRDDMIDKNLYGLYLDAMPHVRDGYSLPEDTKRPIRVAYDMSGVDDTQTIFKYTIGQLIIASLVQIIDNRVYAYSMENALTRNDKTVQQWFSTAAKVLKSNAFPVGAQLQPMTGGTGMDGAFPEIAALTDPTFENNYAMYYLPVPLIWAMNVMFFDKSVKLTQRYPQFKFYSGQRVALADDNFLSAINDAHISIYSSPYEGYPVQLGDNLYYSEEELLKRLGFLRNQRERIQQLEFIFGGMPLSVYSGGRYNNVAYTGAGDSLDTKDVDVYRDFFNPIYNIALPRLSSVYDTPEKMRNLKKQGLDTSYVGSGNNEAQWPNNDDGSLNSNAKKAWYERMRLIGQASSNGGENGTFLWRYLNGEDIVPRYGSRAERVAGQDADGNDVTLAGYISSARLYSINEQAFVGDRDTRDSTYEFLQGVDTAIATATVLGLSSIPIAAAVGATLAGGAGLLAAAGGFATWSASFFAAMSNPVGWVVGGAALLGMVIGGLYAIFDRYDWEDPESNNSIAKFSNDYSPVRLIEEQLPENTPENLKSQRPLDLPGDMVDAAPYFHGHGNTLDKVAVNLLYYELARKSTSIKPLVDKENPNNEIDFIIDFLLLPEEEETIYPKYLVLESEVTPLNNKIFYSEEELNTEERRLKNKIVFSNRDFVYSRRRAIRDIILRINELIADAERLTGDDNFETFRAMRTNAIEFRDNYMDTEVTDVWYGSARANMYIDVGTLAATARTLVTVVQYGREVAEEVENKIIQARNLIIGGGSSRSIVGYINELQEQYEVISAGLPYGRRLTDENYLTQLGKIERDIEQISASVEFAIGEESRVAQRRLEKNKIYGVKDVC